MDDSTLWTDSQALSYIASYDDLRGALGADPEKGRQHYALYGASEGRSIRFDPLAYTASYTDLITAFGLDEAAAARHFIRFGAAEGRVPSFDALRYIASYPDLMAAFGDDVAAGTSHYIRYGVREGREASFDALRYIASYGDLILAFERDTVAATHHYIDLGFNEGRTVRFDPVAYLLSNPGLGTIGLGAEGALLHWVNYGFEEGRVGDSLFGREQTEHILGLGTSVHAAVERNNDRDWFEIDLNAGQELRLDIDFANDSRARLDIYDEGGKRLTSFVSGDGMLPFTALATGTYYVGVTGGETGNYMLSASGLTAANGTVASERVNGTARADIVRGLDGNDLLFGGAGNDILEGGADIDILNGGAGNDILFGNSAANKGTDGADILRDTTGGNDSLYGEFGDDLIEVARGANTAPSDLLMDGGSGNDTLILNIQGRYKDVLIARGGTGNDHILVGSVLSSNINGGSGDDRITVDASGGNHVVTLGSGIDKLTLAATETAISTIGTITLTDFQSATDRVEITHFLSNVLVGWDRGDNPFSAGFLRLVQNGADARLEIDRDGGGSGHGFAAFITFANIGVTSLTAVDLGYDPSGAAGGFSYEGYLNIYTAEGVSEWLPGTDGPNFIDGGGGNDFIEGSDSSNTLWGGLAVGWDTLVGGSGDDMLFGAGIGKGYYYWGYGNDLLVDRQGGNDQLHGGLGSDTLYVNRSGDMMASTVLLDGKTGRDTIIFDAQHRYVDVVTVRGSGDWIYVGSTLRAYIEAGTGSETVIVDPRSRYQSITLGSGADTFVLQRTHQAFQPGTLIELTDFNTSQDKIYIRDYLLDVLIGWDGTSNPFTTGHLRLGDGLYVDPDGQSGPMQAQLLISGILSESRFDVANAALGQVDMSMIGHWSFTHGVDSIDLFSAPDGTVLTISNIRNHAALGEPLDISSNRPVITGTGNADMLVGTQVAEILLGLTGADAMTGGQGDDIYIVDNVGDIVAENPGEGYDTVSTELLNYTMPENVEKLVINASQQIDDGVVIHATGNALDNVIIASGWSVSIDGGVGADTMQGGFGDDSYYVDDPGDQVVEEYQGSSDSINDTVYTALNGYVLPNHVENLVATSNSGQELNGNGFSNRLTGGTGNDLLRDNYGHDRLDGGSGADVMIGGIGDDLYIVDNIGDTVIEQPIADAAPLEGLDLIMTNLISYVLPANVEYLSGTSPFGQTLTGNALDNRIVANAGSDILDGRAGMDQLIGGMGADLFLFSSALGAGNVDMVTGYSVADDSIGLSSMIFAQIGAPGALNPQFFHAGEIPLDAQDRILYNGLTGELFYDSDGNGAGAAIHFATLSNRPALTADDFQVIG